MIIMKFNKVVKKIRGREKYYSWLEIQILIENKENLKKIKEFVSKKITILDLNTDYIVDVDDFYLLTFSEEQVQELGIEVLLEV